jgi:hypothetical protein
LRQAGARVAALEKKLRRGGPLPAHDRLEQEFVAQGEQFVEVGVAGVGFDDLLVHLADVGQRPGVVVVGQQGLRVVRRRGQVGVDVHQKLQLLLLPGLQREALLHARIDKRPGQVISVLTSFAGQAWTGQELRDLILRTAP